jgi:hypothetical protein
MMAMRILLGVSMLALGAFMSLGIFAGPTLAASLTFGTVAAFAIAGGVLLLLSARTGQRLASPPVDTLDTPAPTEFAPIVPTEIDGLNFDVVLLYGRRGKQPERRQVTVHKVEIGRNDAGRPVATLIAGYCHLRKGPRSFLVASIAEMADGATGELLPHPSEWLLNRAMVH